MSDLFSSYKSSLESPAANLIEVTPSDTADLPFSSRALNVSTSGKVRVTTVAGDIATVYIAAGTTFPIRAQRVWNTDTTASDIVVMY